MKPIRSWLSLLLGVAAGVAFAAPGAGEGAGTGFKLTSPAFPHDGLMPVRHTGDGADLSPALAWTEPPAGTRSFALIANDPDAPDPRAPRLVWVHWVLYNIPATLRGLAEGYRPGALPGARDGVSDFRRPGYGGPQPPIGTHRYFFKLYALDALLPEAKAPPTQAQLEKLMAGHILARAELVGRYGRPGR